MEVIKYSNLDIKEQFNDCDNLESIIKKIEFNISQYGRVLCKIKVNGMVLNEKDEARLGISDKSELKEIEVEVSNTDPLIRDTTAELKNHMIGIQESCLIAADYFRGNDRYKAQHFFVKIMAAHKELTESLIVIKPFLVFKREDLLNPWSELELKAVTSVKELLVAYEAQDYVLVSDILEYELSQDFLRWSQLLELCLSQSAQSSLVLT